MEFGESGAQQLGDLDLAWSVASDVGKVRRLNEDSVLAHPGLFLVADGMGGHAAGDVASQITIDVFSERRSSLPLTPTEVEQLVTEANRRVRQRADAEATEGMGTTLVGLALVDNGGVGSLMVFNIGDSRCYSWSEEPGLALLTTDHSVVQELVDAGSLSESEASSHPDRNVVTRAIGVDPSAAADFFVLPRVSHQRLLLCSDGVSGQLSSGSIAECLASDDAPSHGAAALISRVLEGVASDNATCVVVDVRWADVAVEGSAVDDDVTGPRPSAPESSSMIREVPGERATPPIAPLATAVPISEVPQ